MKIYRVSELKNDLSISDVLDVSYVDFFKRRMANQELYKVQGKKCEILFEDSSYVYFGYPFTLKNELFVEKLFRTEKRTLELNFEGYKEIQGYIVKRKSFDNSIKEKVTISNGSYDNINYKIHLLKEGIEVVVKYQERKFFVLSKPIVIRLLFSKKDLVLISKLEF